MQFDDLLASITPEIYQRLVTAVELGKWPDGVALSADQRANSMQLVMAYQAKFCPSEEAFRVGADGQLITRSKAEMKATIQRPAAATIASFPLTDSEL
jgi:uncharacterized protein YeaC (DUF1315 family)